MALLDRGLAITGDNDALYAEKAHVLVQYVNTMTRPVETFGTLLEQARAFASKALGMNPHTGSGQYALGMVCTQSSDPRGACHHFAKAIELNPSHADSAWMLGFVLAAGGRDLDRARQLCDKAAELDPLTPLVRGSLGWVQHFECNFEALLEGWREWQQEVERDRSPFRLLFVWWHAMNGNVDEAFRLADQMASDSPEHVGTAIGRFVTHALRGEKEQALDAVTQRVQKTAKWDDGYSYMMAQGYALIGELDQAFHWLENSIDYGFYNSHFLQHEPLVEDLRSDERFKVALDRAKRLSESLLD
jgi:tetratricopeptide (TPR) repeat protein